MLSCTNDLPINAAALSMEKNPDNLRLAPCPPCIILEAAVLCPVVSRFVLSHGTLLQTLALSRTLSRAQMQALRCTLVVFLLWKEEKRKGLCRYQTKV